MNFKIGKSKSIWAMYDYTVNFPKASQLLPIENIANPLNTFIGNSNLELIKNHSVNLNFNDYDYATRSGYSIYSGADIFDNQVMSSTIFNDSGKRTTTFENVSGTFVYWFGVNWNKTFKKEAHTFKMSSPLCSFLKRGG